MQIIKTLRKNYPIGAIILLLITFINFEYHTQSGGSFFFTGAVIGIIAMSIIGFIVLYRIVDAFHAMCVIKGYLSERVRFKYDILLPIGFIALVLQAQFFSSAMIADQSGEYIHQWEFRWSDPAFSGYFALALIILVLLLRVLAIITALVNYQQTQ